MSSPPKHHPSPSPTKTKASSSVHQKLSLLTTTQSSSSTSKPFMKSKSQTTSSLNFPSFRFSPESEEIEEIIDTTTASHDDLQQEPEGASSQPQPAAASSSTNQQHPSSSGGDISPLKEYLLKHKWANKWDKRSLSLDLDLKGKIITAIEDKRRSFVSHFSNYNEEEEELVSAEVLAAAAAPSMNNPSIITSSHSIPEQLGGGGGTGLLDDDEEQISVHSDSALVHGNRAHPRNFNFDEENCSDYYEFYNDSSPQLDPDDLRDLEIAVEADEIDMELTAHLREFVLPPDKLQESFAGLPTLYQPPSVVSGLRRYPIQELATVDDIEPEKKSSATKSEFVSFKRMIRNTIVDIVYNPWGRYWIGFLAVLVAFDFGRAIGSFLWFLLGTLTTLLLWNAIDGLKEAADQYDDQEDQQRTVSAVEMDLLRRNNRDQRELDEGFWRSQGWMLTLPPTNNNSGNHQPDPTLSTYPSYDAFNFHLRSTRVVFVRLVGSTLIISHPHQKHRVPKRRLWNDPTPNSDHIFVRHQQYNLYGAKVEIVPSGLAKKRVWCKKYPIAITLVSKDKFCGKLLVSELHATASSNGANVKGSPSHGDEHVSFTKDGNVRLGQEEYKGEVYKEDGSCAGKTIYLFARTDREKDDWFRRFVAASKIHAPTQTTPPQSPTYANFIAYMKRACPNLQIPVGPHSPLNHLNNSSLRSTPTNELLFDTVTLQKLTAVGGSPASSRKTTPEKELKSSASLTSELLAPSFLNALVARLFFDFLRSPKWTHEVKQLIDRKLFFIRKPAFVQSLKVKELDLGESLPITLHASAPVLDRQGLWVDLDISYVGNMIITLEAFVNLLKLGASNSNVTNDMESGGPSRRPTEHRHAMFDSDADDSGESSESDDEVELEDQEMMGRESKSAVGAAAAERGGGGATAGPERGSVSTGADNRGKLLKYADTLAKSSMMRNKHVQKMVTGIATTPLLLTVEIKRVIGSLAVNIPPVPNDRVWMGFRSNPLIEINVRPKVGERVVSFSQVTGWIKKKILLEFQRVMVCPNMMDVSIPLMNFELPK